MLVKHLLSVLKLDTVLSIRGTDVRLNPYSSRQYSIFSQENKRYPVMNEFRDRVMPGISLEPLLAECSPYTRDMNPFNPYNNL